MKFPRRVFFTGRSALSLIAALIFGLLIYFNIDVLQRAFNQLGKTDLRIFALVPLMFAGSYFCIANYYVSFFGAFKKKLSIKRVYGLVFALNFVNQILPSGGLSGTTYFIYGIDKSRKKVSAGLATFAHFGRYIFSYASYFFVLMIALFFVQTGDDQLTREFLDTGITLFGVTMSGRLLMLWLVGSSVLLLGLIWWVISTRSHVNAFIGSIGRFLDRVSKLFRKGKPFFGKAVIQKTVTDFHDGYVELRKNKNKLLKPFIFMVLSTTFEVLVVYFSYLAVGASINPGLLMMAFSIANVAGVISVVPGDVGVHETIMVLMLALVGVDKGVALSGALLYRVLIKFFYTAVGFYFYNRILKPVKGSV